MAQVRRTSFSAHMAKFNFFGDNQLPVTLVLVLFVSRALALLLLAVVVVCLCRELRSEHSGYRALAGDRTINCQRHSKLGQRTGQSHVMCLTTRQSLSSSRGRRVGRLTTKMTVLLLIKAPLKHLLTTHLAVCTSCSGSAI